MRNPIKFLDEKVQTMYTKIGKNIPEDKLYKIITPLGLFGGAIGGSSFETAYLMTKIPVYGFFNGLDFHLNANGLRGLRKRNNIEGETRVVNDNPFSEAIERIVKSTRLPVFLSSIGFAAKAGYHTYNYFANGEPLPATFGHDITISLGLLAHASSMYLKDQDPKLLKKKPSKVKAFLEGLVDRVREGAKELFPNPVPQPVPVPVGVGTNYFSYEGGNGK